MWVNLTTCRTWDKSLTHSPVPIVLTSYHRPKTFERCVTSVVRATRQPIYIIDNSQGKIDEQLRWAQEDLGIKIIRNSENLGKPTSIRRHWSKIPQGQWFITMDPDVIVPENGIDDLIYCANSMSEEGYQIGIICPALEQKGRIWAKQLEKKNLVMHNWNEMTRIKQDVYFNSSLAGCLMLVNNLFYNHIGGFIGCRMYNDDDGWLCNESVKHGLLNLINSNVICEHDLSEETSGYRTWKDRNSTLQIDQLGYWDQ